MKLLPFIVILSFLVGCVHQSLDSIDNISDADTAIQWERDSLYPDSYYIDWFFPDSFILQNHDILYFANRLFSPTIYSTPDSMIKWRDDVVNLASENQRIKEIGVDSAISIVENKILPAELLYGGECTLVRVSVANRNTCIWLFRIIDNYMNLRNSVSDSTLLDAIDNEMKAWWKVMELLDSEIHIRIGRYGGSDIGESIGYEKSYILEHRAQQTKQDLIAIKNMNRSLPDTNSARLDLLSIDDYLFCSLEISTIIFDEYSYLKDYIEQIIELRNQLICWLERRNDVQKLIFDKKGYQSNTQQIVSAINDIDSHGKGLIKILR